MNNLNYKPFLLNLIIFLLIGNISYSQEVEIKRTSIRTGIGFGFNMGGEEIGMGWVYSVGWQKSYGKKNRLRLNPNLVFGEFTPFIITDIRNQFYRITSLGLNLHYDLIKYKSFSLVTTAGGFINYSRGLLGTGGRSHIINYKHFNSLYLGGNISLGFKISPKNSKLAYEIRPMNIQFGNNYFTLGYLMFGIDFKL